MLVVVVDTSTPAVTAALVGVSGHDDDPRAGHPRADDPRAGERSKGDAARGAAGVRVLAERCHVNERAHGELLAPGIEEALATAGVAPRDLDAIVAGVGPGPFTGLRVGLVTAAAMGQALSIPTYGVCSLDGIGAGSSGVCLVATDARRREIYWAVYDGGVRVSGPGVNRPADLADVLAGLDLVPASAAGDGAARYAEVLALPVLEDLRYPSPAALALSCAEHILAKGPSQTLTPLYLRRPDAIEAREARRANP